MTKLYAAIHSVQGSVPAAFITLGTQAALSGGWILGPGNPATHAFIVVEHDDGYCWRLDAKPSRAEWTPTHSPLVRLPSDPPAAFWKLSGDLDIQRGIQRAFRITDASYDWSEIAGATAAALAFLPFLSRLRHLANTDVFKGAMICTQAARSVVRS